MWALLRHRLKASGKPSEGYTVVAVVAIFPYSDELSLLRGISYREFLQLVYGTLCRLRTPLPACVIQTKLGDNSDVFTGIEEDIDY